MRVSVLLAAAFALTLALVWKAGGFATLGWWLLDQQRALQSLLAAQMAGLQGGGSGALVALMGVCAVYGFLHALGPGHGKLLVGGAAVCTGSTAARMAGIAVAGSLAQSLMAILLVYGGLALVGATARATVGASEAWALPVGNALVAGIGVWMLVRGVRAWGMQRDDHRSRHDHGHPDDACGCGHRHGLDAHDVTAAVGPAGMLALVGAMAARPCTGAMMLLAIAWSMGFAAAGAAGALAMGAGTAAFTVVVALLAVWGRETTLGWFAGASRARRLLPGLQVAVGLVLAIPAAALLVAALAAPGDDERTLRKSRAAASDVIRTSAAGVAADRGVPTAVKRGAAE